MAWQDWICPDNFPDMQQLKLSNLTDPTIGFAETGSHMPDAIVRNESAGQRSFSEMLRTGLFRLPATSVRKGNSE